MDNFWNDETVKEMIYQKLILPNRFMGDAQECLDEFKESKDAPKSERPPLGIRPQWIVAEERVKEINEGIDRYFLAGKAIPQEWYDELSDLDNYLVKRQEGTPPQPPKEGNVVEQVTAFRWINHGHIFQKIGSVFYDGSRTAGFQLDSFLKNCDYEIYSAKNKDGVEFTIGDSVYIDGADDRRGLIRSIYIDRDRILAKWGDDYSSKIDNLIKEEKNRQDSYTRRKSNPLYNATH